FKEWCRATSFNSINRPCLAVPRRAAPCRTVPHRARPGRASSISKSGPGVLGRAYLFSDLSWACPCRAPCLDFPGAGTPRHAQGPPRSITGSNVINGTKVRLILASPSLSSRYGRIQVVLHREAQREQL